ncbi:MULTISPECIES: ATP-binding cassette domain-containing protein [Mumia]|uniref:ATP-binding cassette domain-containing protein n=1 Tax=Mumia TaxID=1546255 RepID=UPI001E336428|nr:MULTISPECIES: ABC transporter ATP-binding protein [Mumia]
MRDLDLTVEPGERVLLAGPSGAGKSTVLRALAGVLGSAGSGDAYGEVHVAGRIGLLMQNPADAVVAERIGRDVAFGLENAGVAREEIWRRVRLALEAVRLPYAVDHPTAALSGGEQQRLALAGVLASDADLLLLDEPTSMLDAPNADGVRRCVLEAVARTGATLVVVEHRIGPWLSHVDRVVVLDADGVVVRDTDPVTFAADPVALAEQGVWMPGVAAPVPLEPPAGLVAPSGGGVPVVAEALHVDLRRSSMRGTTVTPALRGVDVELVPGALTVLTGPSGAGKSTLVAALAGLVAPTSGIVSGLGGGRAPHRMRSRDLARRVGWVPQNPEHGFVTTHARDEVAATGARTGVTVDAAAVLAHLGLGDHAAANPYRLSGGEQRRLATAAALAHRPPVLLLDEPTVGQDRLTWAAVVGWVRAAADAGAAVGIATHDPDLVALADRVVALQAGEVLR